MFEILDIDYDRINHRVEYSVLAKTAKQCDIDLLDVAHIFRKKGNCIQDELDKNGKTVHSRYLILLVGMYCSKLMEKGYFEKK